MFQSSINTNLIEEFSRLCVKELRDFDVSETRKRYKFFFRLVTVEPVGADGAAYLEMS